MAQRLVIAPEALLPRRAGQAVAAAAGTGPDPANPSAAYSRQSAMRTRTTTHHNGTPLASIATGALAGAAGTLAMDTLWYRRYRRDGGEDSFLDWELASGTTSYEQAAAPAQLGKRLVEGYLQTELPPHTARAMTNAFHWATGLLWGTVHGVLAGSTAKRRISAGLATGVGAWAASYAMLAPAKLYKPMWEYPPGVLWKDLSAHLIYGLGTGAAFRALTADASTAAGSANGAGRAG